MKPQFESIDDFLSLLQDVRGDNRKTNHWMAKCPVCDDKHRHLSITLDGLVIGLHCFHNCATESVIAHYGLTMAHLFLADPNKPKRGPGRPPKEDKQQPKKVAAYAYRDEQGHELSRKVRLEPGPHGEKKTFYQETPDGGRDLTGVRRVLYNLPNVLKEKARGGLIVKVEGEKDVGTLAKDLHITGTCNPEGCNKWDASYSESLRDGDVLIIPDQDKAGITHGLEVAQGLDGVARRVRILYLPDGFKDITEWVEAGHTRSEFSDHLLPLAQVFKREGLDTIVACCKKWLYLEDVDAVGSVLVTLGTVAANKIPGDPVWLLVIATPASGKTEIIRAIDGIKDIYPVSTLSEASLLSGTSRKDAPYAKGGVLNEMGAFGILRIKDFGGIMSLNRESRATVLAALREIYDGSWVRLVGSEGGRHLTWEGKCGLIGGATPVIDTQYTIMAILGERFNYYRLPVLPDDQLKLRADKALEHAGQESTMRSELSSMIASFFSGIGSAKPQSFTTQERDKLTALATFSTRCRSPIDRDAYHYEDIRNIPGVEAPNRMVKVLAQLLRGLRLIGVDYNLAWHLVEKTAIDSMPELRRKLLTSMLNNHSSSTPIPTQEAAVLVGYPTNTARRVLEDMSCYGVVDRILRGSDGGSSTSDTWLLTDWTLGVHQKAIVELDQPEALAQETIETTNGAPEIRQEIHNNNKLPNKTINNLDNIEARISGKSLSNTLSFVCPNCKSRQYWIGQGNAKKCAKCWTPPEGAKVFEDD